MIYFYYIKIIVAEREVERKKEEVGEKKPHKTVHQETRKCVQLNVYMRYTSYQRLYYELTYPKVNLILSGKYIPPLPSVYVCQRVSVVYTAIGCHHCRSLAPTFIRSPRTRSSRAKVHFYRFRCSTFTLRATTRRPLHFAGCIG